MVAARLVNNGLDKAIHAQQRRMLPSESSQTHHGRRGKTSLTYRNPTAIFNITLFSSSESACYDAILQREHHFYNRVPLGGTLVDEFYNTKMKLSTLHHSCPRPYSFCMNISTVRMEVLKTKSSSHSMIHAARH